MARAAKQPKPPVTPEDYMAAELPVRPLENPLGPNDEQAINFVLQRIAIGYDMIKRAADVGLDVEARMQQHQMHHRLVGKLKERFFPDQLPAPNE
jgi:hypothetical protein